MFCATDRAVYLSNDGLVVHEMKSLSTEWIRREFSTRSAHEQTSRHTSSVNHLASIVWLFDLGTRTVEVSY